MSDTHLQRTLGDSYAIPHQLCRCCKRFSDEFARIWPSMQETYEQRIIPQYDSLQDLVDGAKRGCHLCTLVLSEWESSLHRSNQGKLRWLRSAIEGFASVDDAPKMVLSTCIENDVWAWLKLDARSLEVGNEEYEGALPSLIIENLDKSSVSKVTSSEVMERIQLSNHVASGDHYHLIRRWLKECTDNAKHPACNTNETFRRPTRLLDLTYYHEDVKLVMGASTYEPYAALSYCWGSAPQPMLLMSNLQHFQERIFLANLSQVAQDAIAVCRQLSIPYLWVDALCIVQGADGDFLSEAPRMQEVYAGSTLSIVAASSKNTTEPFLHYRNPLHWINCELDSSENRSQNRYVVQAERFCQRNRPGSYHIDTRAWYFQERFMSPRSIYFGDKGIHWECRRGVACEIDAEIHDSHESTGNGQSFSVKCDYARLQSMQVESLSEEVRGRGIWRALLAAYTAMSLSHSEDRLIAIAGIASIFESKFDRVSTYGLWIDTIMQDLLWVYDPYSYSANERDGEPAENLPSWSWTSVNGRLITSSPDYGYSNDEMDKSCSATLTSWPSDSGFNTSLGYSQRNKSLCIRGHLAPYHETWWGKKHDVVHTNSERQSYRSYFKDPRTYSEGSDLSCLLLLCQFRSERGQRVFYNYGLVLTPVNLAERCYRRTGIIEEIHPADEFPDASATQFVQGEFLTDLWAPVGEEQEVYII